LLQTVWNGAIELERRLRDRGARVREVRQREQRVRVVAQVLGGAEQVLEVARRAPGVSRNAGTPRLSAAFTSGSVVGSSARGRLEVARHVREARQERRLDAERLGRRVSVGGLSEIVSRAPPGRARWRANVVAMLADHAACTCATGATCAAAAPRPGKSLAQLRLRCSTGCASPAAGSA
jgi:hypothetical protein